MSRSKKKLRGRDEDDHQFEQFLRESVSSEDSSIDTARVMNYLDPQRRKDKTWMDEVEEEDDDVEFLGLTGTGSKFIKKKPVLSEAKPTSKNKEKVEKSVSFSQDVGMSKDSLDDESLGLRMNGDLYGHDNGRSVPVVPALSLDSTQSATDTGTANQIKSLMAGKETLDELADKERFFKNLERSSEETLDYSQMNKDLDLSGTMGSTLQDPEDPDHRHLENPEDQHSDLESQGNSPQITAVRTGDRTGDKQTDNKGIANDDRQSMLSKVALLDSLDSTLGTKPAASRETADSADMQTIPEGTREEDVTTDDHRRIRKTRFEDEEGTMGQRADIADSTTGRGVTLKTTGLAYTDTSREIEALHQALQQVGMGTLDDTKDLTLIHTSTRTHDTSAENGTGVFGLHPVAPPRTGEKPRRTVEDIMREVEELTGHSNQDLYTDQDQPDTRGFDLSPAYTAATPGGMDTLDETDQGYDYSPAEKRRHSVKFLPPHSQNSGIPPATPPRSRSRTRIKDSSDGAPIPAKRNVHKDKKTKSKYSHVRGSGYGQRSPSPKRSQTNRNWSPAEIHKQKIRGTESIQKVKRDLQVKEVTPPSKAGSMSENHLVQSVQSFASYIQDHFSKSAGQSKQDPSQQTGSGWSTEKTDVNQKMAALDREQKLVDEVRTWQEQIQEERKLFTKAKAEQMATEREYKHKLEQQRMDHEQEVFRLKQENFVLSAKISEDSKSKQRQRPSSPSADSTGGGSREQEKLLEREIEEQEKLLAGYQQENERLYQEMKKMQQDSKEIEQKMFKENQKLNTDLANLRETLAQKELALKNKGVITGPAVQQHIAAGGVGPAVLGAGRIAQLEAELKQAKAKQQLLQLEVNTLTATKGELEQHIEDLVSKIEQFEARLKESSTLQSEQTKRKITKLEQEIERLNNKLKWYAENQEFLDKDAKKLKRKDEEIYKLKQKIESLHSESGRKNTEAKAKAKERSLDAKKIQDLERQVKEMENIIRKRHPNSLPVLMWAASGAPDTENRAPSVAFLEKQLQKLQTELDTKDEDGKKSLRVLEQKYTAMKFQYEERIQGLEDQLSTFQRPGDKKLREGDHPHTHVSALQRELDSVKDRHRKKQAETEAELEKVKKELSASRSKENALKSSESKSLKDNESDLQLRVKALQLEVTNQDKEKQLLQKTIERLGQEKQQLTIDVARLAEQNSKAQAGKLQNKLQSRTGKPSIVKAGEKKVSPRDKDPFGPETSQPLAAITEAWQEKEYQPLVFAGQHVSEILRDNEQLRQKVELLQLDVDQHRVTTQKLLAENEAQSRKSREETDDKILAMKAAHQAEIQRLLADHALHNSTSRVAELQGKLDTQEVVVRHLKEQLSQNSVDREKMSTLQIRETTLGAQVRQLMDELREAKNTHTPEMKHFTSLQDKVRHMEERHAQREQELQTIIQHSRTVAHADLNQEISKWRHIVDSKNQELDKFRSELDGILEVLKELQRQGVILPYRGISPGLSHR